MRSFRSAHTRVLCGSAAFAVAAAGFGGACAAQPAGDGLTQPAAYHGPFLTWAGKTGGPVATPPAPAPQSSAQEFASWPAPAQPATARLRASPPRQYAAAAPTYAPAYAPAPPQPRPRVAYAAPPAPQPKPAAVAAYAAPPVQPIHRRPTAQLAVSTPPAAPAQAQPPAQQLAQNDTTAAPAASPAVLQPTGAHFYSLHREYGLTPDAVVTPKDRPMVLIGPPDNPPSDKQDNADGAGGSNRHGDGEGADD
jgi:hypothetical protein